MANKITETISLKISGTGFSATMSGSVTSDQTGQHYTEQTQVITSTAAEQLDIAPDITEGNLGYLLIRNTALKPESDTVDPNVVHIATDEAMDNKIATIQPEKGAFVPPPSGTVTLWAQSATGDATVIYLAVEK